MDPANTRHTMPPAPVDPEAAADTRLQLVGGFRLWVSGADTDLPLAAQRLMALLALRGRMSRSRLAGALWSQTSENRALANLRTAIWRVNHVASSLLHTSTTAVDLGVAIEVDVRRLVRAADLLIGDDVTHEQLHDVWRLARHITGELLPDWDDEWLLDDRQRLRQLQLHALELFADRFVREGLYGPALDAALAALRADTLRESAHRAVIRVHLAEGNTVEAQRALEFCRLVLTRDAGVEPTGATTQLVLPRDSLVASESYPTSG